MSDTSSTRLGRRTVLRSVAAVLGLGAVGSTLRPDAAAATSAAAISTEGRLRVRRLFQLVDRKRQQRIRISDTKPPVFHDGVKYPPSIRHGDKDATWITFNDENQDERGGLTASSGGGSMSFDYANAQAVTLETVFIDDIGAAALSMNQQPDPTIPILEVTDEDSPRRVILYTDTQGNGALLYLNDSAGRPRISLQVDADDVPRIQILDADGEVVAQLPADAPPARTSAKSTAKSVTEFLAQHRPGVTARRAARTR